MILLQDCPPTMPLILVKVTLLHACSYIYVVKVQNLLMNLFFCFVLFCPCLVGGVTHTVVGK